MTIYEKSVIRRAVGGGNLGDNVTGELGKVEAILPGDDLPGRTERAEFGIDPLLACLPFRLVHLNELVARVFLHCLGSDLQGISKGVFLMRKIWI